MPDTLSSEQISIALRDTAVADTAKVSTTLQSLSGSGVVAPQKVMDFAGLLAKKGTQNEREDSISVPLIRIEEALLPKEPGVVGTPIPYNFRTDSYLAGVLVLCFVLMVWFFSRSQHYIIFCLKSFFRMRPVANERNDHRGSEIYGQILIIGQLCLTLGVLYYDYLQEVCPDLRSVIAESPYIIIGVTAGMMLGYGCIKSLLYMAVNNVFFSKGQCAEWREAYIHSVMVTGLLLFPVTLLVVYLDMPLDTQILLFVSIIGVVKVVLFLKCIRTFFGGFSGSLHLILYFCTLEIAPALCLWRVLFCTNTNLAITI